MMIAVILSQAPRMTALMTLLLGLSWNPEFRKSPADSGYQAVVQAGLNSPRSPFSLYVAAGLCLIEARTCRGSFGLGASTSHCNEMSSGQCRFDSFINRVSKIGKIG